MQDAMATVLKSNVDKLVQASPFFSLLIDVIAEAAVLVS